VGTFLIQTDATDPATVAGRVRGLVGPTAQGHGHLDQRKLVGSNLTAVGMAGLTRVELVFALVLVASATGLVLALGFAERRRTFAIRQRAGCPCTRTGRVRLGRVDHRHRRSLALGGADRGRDHHHAPLDPDRRVRPPPDAPAIPGAYLAGLVALAVAATAVGGAVTLRRLRRPAISALADA
jgi:putative ABC transport system permease protein